MLNFKSMNEPAIYMLIFANDKVIDDSNGVGTYYRGPIKIVKLGLKKRD